MSWIYAFWMCHWNYGENTCSCFQCYQVLLTCRFNFPVAPRNIVAFGHQFTRDTQDTSCADQLNYDSKDGLLRHGSGDQIPIFFYFPLKWHTWEARKQGQKAHKCWCCQIEIRPPSSVEINQIWLEYLPMCLSFKQTDQVSPDTASDTSLNMQIATSRL